MRYSKEQYWEAYEELAELVGRQNMYNFAWECLNKSLFLGEIAWAKYFNLLNEHIDKKISRSLGPSPFFGNLKTKAEAKQIYRLACLEHHPDVGGDHDFFIEIKRQYELLTPT